MPASSRQIRTLLVANRGEIARRVIRTARAMGIGTVAIYSEPDAGSPHVTDADRAVPLRGATAAETYLDVTKVLDAAQRARADAVHPGYGFLSENAEFAEACAVAGLLFVGPDPRTMREMGLKDRAKAIARAAGVPVLPDAAVPGDDPAAWLAAAQGVGYPLLVKATAGGGGKGMRRVSGAADLVDAVEGARREAASSFGNATVFLERYLTAPRHIEIQVFGDQHGSALHLLERECSVQRRHQKVLEEAPSPAVDEAVRASMGQTAVALVRELGYVGAGTVEYLLDDSGPDPEFFFLEMNTRLQVEHQVTEQVLGLDLVRLQLEVAMGLPLQLRQDDVVPRGHAIEVRLYAEDTARDFLPTPGALLGYDHVDLPGLRYEDGVAAPSSVSPYYDPMLAKVVAVGSSRPEAARRLAAALERFTLHGLVTNRDFLAALLRDPDFLAGQTHTDFIERHPDLLTPACRTPVPVHLGAALAVGVLHRRRADPVTGHAPPGWRALPGSVPTQVIWAAAERPDDAFVIGYRLSGVGEEEQLALFLEDGEHALLLHGLHRDGVRVGYQGAEWTCGVVAYDDGSVWVNDADGQSGWRPRPRLPAPSSARSATGPVSELPGTVVAVRVKAGDLVVAGQQLVVLEAMKMEHPAFAATDGVVAEVHVEVGQYVDAHTVLVTLEPGGEA